MRSASPRFASRARPRSALPRSAWTTSSVATAPSSPPRRRWRRRWRRCSAAISARRGSAGSRSMSTRTSGSDDAPGSDMDRQPRPRAGDTVTLMAETRSFRNAPQVHRLEVPVPATATGIAAVAGHRRRDARAAGRTAPVARAGPQRRRTRHPAQPGSSRRPLVRAAHPRGPGLGRQRPRHSGPSWQRDAGARRRTRRRRVTLDQDVLGEWELPADAVATGQRTLSFTPLVP